MRAPFRCATFGPIASASAIVPDSGRTSTVKSRIRPSPSKRSRSMPWSSFAPTRAEKTIQGIDLLRFDADGKIRDFTVLVRPLSATIALAEAMGPKVAHLKGRSA